jgi:hypothetical protein
MEKKNFPLEVILTVICNRMLINSLEPLQDFLEFFTGNGVYSHQIGTVIKKCAPYILEQHPLLKLVNVKQLKKMDKNEWGESFPRLCNAFGKELPIEPLPPDTIPPTDQVKELFQNTKTKENILVVYIRSILKQN